MRYSRLILLGLVFAAMPSPAWAYLDPGASSIAYQVLVGGILAVSFALRRSWKKLFDLFSRRHSETQTPPPGTGTK